MGRRSDPDLSRRIAGHWYRPNLTLLTAALAPMAWAYGAVVAARRALYRMRVLRSETLPVPVIVVGNITAGGTGKTPLVIALVQALAERGLHPGVVSRGFGRMSSQVQSVAASSQASDVGDEPLLMARRGLHVAVGARRVDAARALLHAYRACDVIVADDGLQHYALERDVEIAVIDGVRALGNRRLIPAGPLREPPARLRGVDAVVVNDPAQGVAMHFDASTFVMRLVPREFVNVADASRTLPLDAFTARRVHAIAGIGHPARFFATLRDLRIDAIVKGFPDHHPMRRDDLPAEASVILMTEKDAVKCAAFGDARCWFLRVEAEVDRRLFDLVLARLPSRAKSR